MSDGNHADLYDEEVYEKVREELDQIHDFHSAEDLKWILSDVRGRRFIWRLLEEAGVFASSYDGSETNTVFNEGKRLYGLQVLEHIMEVYPEVFTTMMKEKKDYERHILTIQHNGANTE